MLLLLHKASPLGRVFNILLTAKLFVMSNAAFAQSEFCGWIKTTISTMEQAARGSPPPEAVFNKDLEEYYLPSRMLPPGIESKRDCALVNGENRATITCKFPKSNIAPGAFEFKTNTFAELVKSCIGESATSNRYPFSRIQRGGCYNNASLIQARCERVVRYDNARSDADRQARRRSYLHISTEYRLSEFPFERDSDAAYATIRLDLCVSCLD